MAKVSVFSLSASSLLIALSFSFAARAADEVITPNIDPAAMDQNVNPCEDFYQYSCGGWLKRTEIPSDQSRWSRSFSTLSEQNTLILKNILESYARGEQTPKTQYAKKLGDYYAACMDETAIEKQTPAVVKAAMEKIERLRDKQGLPALVGELQAQGVDIFFSLGAQPDFKKPELTIAQIDQGGLSLPSSENYNSDDEAKKKIREEFQAHVGRMLRLAGQNDDPMAVYRVEAALAKDALPPEQRQDPATQYHPLSQTDLYSAAPAFNWPKFFSVLGSPVPKVINVSEPKFLSSMDKVLQTIDMPTLKAYLKYHVLSRLAGELGKDYYNESFDFYSRKLNGQTEPSPRWKRCANSVSSGMSEALGQAFVAKTFSPEAKKKTMDLIANLRAAFDEDLRQLEWLDDPTRAQALVKLKQIFAKAGYPDKWRNYDSLPVSRTSYVANSIAASKFETTRTMKKMDKPTDPTEWGMSPQTVNAYYDPTVNQIAFPAGILQIPFFSEKSNDAANYGAIGWVIGHEMTHGFDTSGSQFDGKGAMKDWWTPAVKQNFAARAQCLKDQFSKYEVLPGLYVNGNLTITENIADHGGIKLAYNAFQLAQKGKPAPAPIAGLDQNQQFFVAGAQVWCEKDRDAAVRRQVETDPHSPAKFRVIGSFVNRPEFQAAFKCPAGSPMAPANRCSVW